MKVQVVGILYLPISPSRAEIVTEFFERLSAEGVWSGKRAGEGGWLSPTVPSQPRFETSA